MSQEFCLSLRRASAFWFYTVRVKTKLSATKFEFSISDQASGAAVLKECYGRSSSLLMIFRLLPASHAGVARSAAHLPDELSW